MFRHEFLQLVDSEDVLVVLGFLLVALLVDPHSGHVLDLHVRHLIPEDVEEVELDRRVFPPLGPTGHVVLEHVDGRVTDTGELNIQGTVEHHHVVLVLLHQRQVVTASGLDHQGLHVQSLPRLL